MLERAFDGSKIQDAASLEDAAAAANGESPDVVIVDPWRVGVDVGEVVGRLQSELGLRSWSSPPTAGPGC